jgi:hypothetical protein
MSRIRKAYYTLDELVAAWGFPDPDLRYVIENDLLVVSIRIVGHVMEFGDYEETPEGESFPVPHACRAYDGLVDLCKRDAVAVLRGGQAEPRQFSMPAGGYACLARETDCISIERVDLLVERARRVRFEAEALPSLAVAQAHDSTFERFNHRGRLFAFTPTQARVLDFLHASALAGAPWQPGKTALAAAGSTSVKIGDLFKRRPEWREIVEHDGRGSYRLTEGLLRQAAA